MREGNMSLAAKILILCSTFTVGVYADSLLSLTGPDEPTISGDGPANGTAGSVNSTWNFTGISCDPVLNQSGVTPGNGPGHGNNVCISGAGTLSTTAFVPLSASLTYTAGVFTYTEQTYAPNGLDGYGPNAFGDAFIKDANGNLWAIPIGTASMGTIAPSLTLGTPGTSNNLAGTAGGDGLNLGNVYNLGNGGSQESNAWIANLISGGFPGLPVEINASNLALGTNTAPSGTSSSFTIAQDVCTDQFQGGGACTGFGLWTITDQFTSADLYAALSAGQFAFEVSSYVCGNGAIIGNSGTSSVPEPRWGFLAIPALLLFARRFSRLHAKPVA